MGQPKMKVVVYRTEHPLNTVNYLRGCFPLEPKEVLEMVRELGNLTRGSKPLAVLYTSDLSLAQWVQDGLREVGATASVVPDVSVGQKNLNA